MEYAKVKRDGYEVPLIGVPKSAQEECCEQCGNRTSMQDAAWVEGRLICWGCRQPHPESVVEVVSEPGDREAELSKKQLTDEEIQENLPEVWKERAIAGKHQIAIPIKGTIHHS